MEGQGPLVHLFSQTEHLVFLEATHYVSREISSVNVKGFILLHIVDEIEYLFSLFCKNVFLSSNNLNKK